MPVSDFRLRPLQPPDTDAVTALWARRFGGQTATRQSWMDAVLDPNHIAAAWVAEAGATVVGFGVLEVAHRAYTRQYLGLDTLPLDVPLADRNGLFHMCCVRRDWEGHGIGTALHQRRLQALADRDVPRAHGIAWHRPDGAPDSRSLFAAQGFTQIAPIVRYYARTQDRAHCPVCGDTCSCHASLYTRAVLPM